MWDGTSSGSIVIGRAEDDAILGAREELYGQRESAIWNCRTVGIDQTNGIKRKAEEIIRCGQESFTEITSPLRDEDELLRENFRISGLRAGRRIPAHG